MPTLVALHCHAGRGHGGRRLHGRAAIDFSWFQSLEGHTYTVRYYLTCVALAIFMHGWPFPFSFALPPRTVATVRCPFSQRLRPYLVGASPGPTSPSRYRCLGHLLLGLTLNHPFWGAVLLLEQAVNPDMAGHSATYSELALLSPPMF